MDTGASGTSGLKATVLVVEALTYYAGALKAGGTSTAESTELVKRLVALVERDDQAHDWVAWGAVEVGYSRDPAAVAEVLATTSSVALRAHWIASAVTLPEHMPMAGAGVDRDPEEVLSRAAISGDLIPHLWPHLGDASRLALLEACAGDWAPTQELLTWASTAHEALGLERSDFLDRLGDDLLVFLVQIQAGEEASGYVTLGEAFLDAPALVLAAAGQLGERDPETAVRVLVEVLGATRDAGVLALADALLARCSEEFRRGRVATELRDLEASLSAEEVLKASVASLVADPSRTAVLAAQGGWDDAGLLELAKASDLDPGVLKAVVALLEDRKAFAAKVLEEARYFPSSRATRSEPGVVAFHELLAPELQELAKDSPQVLVDVLEQHAADGTSTREVLLQVPTAWLGEYWFEGHVGSVHALVSERVVAAQDWDAFEVLIEGFTGSLAELLEVVEEASS